MASVATVGTAPRVLRSDYSEKVLGHDLRPPGAPSKTVRRDLQPPVRQKPSVDLRILVRRQKIRQVTIEMTMGTKLVS